MEKAEEERLDQEGVNYRFVGSQESAADPSQSKSFMKKMQRIQRQKERRSREKQQKREAEGEVEGEVKRVSIEEQVAMTMERYRNSKKTLLVTGVGWALRVEGGEEQPGAVVAGAHRGELRRALSGASAERGSVTGGLRGVFLRRGPTDHALQRAQIPRRRQPPLRCG